MFEPLYSLAGGSGSYSELEQFTKVAAVCCVHKEVQEFLELLNFFETKQKISFSSSNLWSLPNILFFSPSFSAALGPFGWYLPSLLSLSGSCTVTSPLKTSHLEWCCPKMIIFLSSGGLHFFFRPKPFFTPNTWQSFSGYQFVCLSLFSCCCHDFPCLFHTSNMMDALNGVLGCGWMASGAFCRDNKLRFCVQNLLPKSQPNQKFFSLLPCA